MLEESIYYHRAQYYETDQMQIVHHSNYIRWFEEARTFLMNEGEISYAKMEKDGILVPVLGVDAKYHSMVKFYDTVKITSWIDHYNGIKMTIAYKIEDKESGELRCSGSSEHCFLDKDYNLISLKRKYPDYHHFFIQLTEFGQQYKKN